MLELKNITKSYTTENFTQKALDSVDLSFGRNEFAAILGPSGSGKTTLLNVIGGLDTADSGELIINGRSTADFKATDWDAYRNNSIGFIFQSYNLIGHLSVLSNVEMGMTLSGVSAAEKRKKAEEALALVGLSDHAKKRPAQLSGGQMQRVAIARALANDPEIILADEPTGALDKTTGEQIMDLIKEISKDKLVIFVTHNRELADRYADRIISFEDGRPVADTAQDQAASVPEEGYTLRRTAMSFFTALSLSFGNITTKKGRTFLTALASSIGIIGIALILSLSDGFGIQIEKYEDSALSEFPVVISRIMANFTEEDIQRSNDDMTAMLTGKREYADTDYVTAADESSEIDLHLNKFSAEYTRYLESADPDVCDEIGYTRLVAMNAVTENPDGSFRWVTFPTGISGMTSYDSSAASNYQMSGVGLASYPQSVGGGGGYLREYYDLLEGEFPAGPHDAVLVVDSMNSIGESVLDALGFDISAGTVPFSDVIGKEYRLIGNDDFYTKAEQYGFYIQNTDYGSMYESENAIPVKISGIVRLKDGQTVGLLGFGLAYSDELVSEVIGLNRESALIEELRTSSVNVMDPALPELDEEERSDLMLKYGGDAEPFVIYLYPGSFETKDKLLSYLDAWNDSKDEVDKVYYIDMSAAVTQLTGSIMKAVTLVLVAFAAISLVVSLIMISIITYISVLERRKEIGILRALGARGKDISRVFNAETFIIGVSSGLLGIIIARLLIIPINILIEGRTGLAGVAVLNPLYAAGLIAVSVILTLIGGFIPAKIAAKRDPVEALRSE
ncbi:MAG: ABC transporter ATP-binding protein/permease [Clostridia bacterium]|nr:ABC transporter ATP-binding protein/permease [Clostridia bacterium]